MSFDISCKNVYSAIGLFCGWHLVVVRKQHIGMLGICAEVAGEAEDANDFP